MEQLKLLQTEAVDKRKFKRLIKLYHNFCNKFGYGITIFTLIEFLHAKGYKTGKDLFRRDDDYYFRFKGADRVANILIRQRNMKELTPILLQIPNVHPGWWATKLLEAHELGDLELAEGIIPDEIMVQLQALAAQQELQNQVLLAQIGGRQQPANAPPQTGSRFKQNNTAQEAVAAGRENDEKRPSQ